MHNTNSTKASNNIIKIILVLFTLLILNHALLATCANPENAPIITVGTVSQQLTGGNYGFGKLNICIDVSAADTDTLTGIDIDYSFDNTMLEFDYQYINIANFPFTDESIIPIIGGNTGTLKGTDLTNQGINLPNQTATEFGCITFHLKNTIPSYEFTTTAFAATDKNGAITTCPTMVNVSPNNPTPTPMSNSNARLPITWSHFEIYQDDVNEISLEWGTETELDNAFFEIQKSKDGLAFETIGRVEGAGTSINPIFYDYLDKVPFEGINYYRLKQVDRDGDFSFSKIISIQSDSKTLTSNFEINKLYYNRYNQSINLKISSHKVTEVNLRIFNIQGHELTRKEILFLNENEINRFELNNISLPNGVYIIQIINNQYYTSKKISIIN